MGLIIAGERSGVGKTTITLALLAALRQRHLTVQSFKVGPDYIDPMFHRAITNRPCRNLDPVLTSETYLQQCFNFHSQNVDCTIIEGVMGLFDGARGEDDFASTAHIARILDLPVVLVLDCSRLSRSVAAIVHGYRSFDPKLRLAGVVLNRVGSDRHRELLQTALEPLQIPILGLLHRQAEITIPDRHLGLVPTAELPQLTPLIARLADLAEASFDWPRLWPLLAAPMPGGLPNLPAIAAPENLSRVRIAVACDRAFSFYYADNLDILQQLGAELVFWSPLEDTHLPEGVQGLYFGGGFPEVFAAELVANSSGCQAVREAITSGMPTYAECGGLMYLSQQIVDFEAATWPMVGILPTTAIMGQRLTLGYRQAIAQADTPLVTRGAKVVGHEFHRSYLKPPPCQPLFHLQGSLQMAPTLEGWYTPSLHASYLHTHWGEQIALPRRFLHYCRRFGDRDPVQPL